MPKKRRQPRRKATTIEHAEQLLMRNERLLDQWLAKLGVAARKIAQYRGRVGYYRQRVDYMQFAETERLQQALLAAEQHNGRQTRAIDLSES